MSTKIGVIILTYNNVADTCNLLESISKQGDILSPILVVDNHSSDDSLAHIKSAFPEYQYLVTASNLFYSGGINSGIKLLQKKYSDLDYIFLFNNDVILPGKSFFSHMVVTMKNYKADILAPLAIYPDGSFQTRPSLMVFPTIKLLLKSIYDRFLLKAQPTFNSVYKVDWVPNGYTCFKANLLYNYYLGDDFPMDLNDVDYCAKIGKKKRIFLDCRIRVIHRNNFPNQKIKYLESFPKAKQAEKKFIKKYHTKLYSFIYIILESAISLIIGLTYILSTDNYTKKRGQLWLVNSLKMWRY